MSTGSLKITAPAGIVVDALPLNFSARPDRASIADSCPRGATWAAPTTSGAVPNWLLNTTRRRSPPSVGRTTRRSVWLLKLRTGGVGGGPAGATAAGAGSGAACGVAAGGTAGAWPRPAAAGCCAGATTSAVAHAPTQRSAGRPL